MAHSSNVDGTVGEVSLVDSAHVGEAIAAADESPHGCISGVVISASCIVMRRRVKRLKPTLLGSVPQVRWHGPDKLLGFGWIARVGVAWRRPRPIL